MKTKSYNRYNLEIQRRIREFLTPDEIKSLHQFRAWRHFAIVARQVLLLVGIGFLCYRFSQPWIWIPLAALQGFVILGFIILLHEQVHNAIFAKRRPFPERLLGLFYALPSAISATQFKRWHLDHHNELGSTTEDPKRAYLSPKRNARWYKALYMTPALFVIYSLAAAKEAKVYTREMRRTIALERIAFIGLHLTLAWWLVSHGGWDAWLRVHFVPLFGFFPVAFMLNRLGQHYAVDPEDPAKWSTLVNSHWFWDWIFLYSNMHLEHHYLVGVPFYNLPALNRKLQPFYKHIGLRNYTYAQILHGWFIRNEPPHTNWDRPAAQPASPRGSTAGAA